MLLAVFEWVKSCFSAEKSGHKVAFEKGGALLVVGLWLW
jgi:hypothetical protein